MKLIKVKNGLLEAENFFLVSTFGDFAGSNNVSRDIATGELKLISDNKIERSFAYNEFVIEVKKENFTTPNPSNYAMIYLGNSDYTFGIKDNEFNTQHNYWKILKQDNYIQAYVSEDGVNYINIGGMEFSEDITKQGFMKYGTEDFILDDYKVYTCPYLTIQNYPSGTICELYDTENNLLIARAFDDNFKCKIYLDNNNIEGYFTFKDTEGNIIGNNTDPLVLGYGDVWVCSPYNFEIIYHGSVISDITPALLQDLDELMVIKNVGSKDYTGLVIGTQTSSNDLVQLSLDGVTYANTISIDIYQNEEKNIYVKVTKNVNNHNFSVRDFQLIINE